MKSTIFKLLLLNLVLLLTSPCTASISDLIPQWKKEGYITLGVPVKLDKLEPTKFLNAHTKLSLPLIYEPLVSIGAQQELRPILAKSWVVASNAKSVTITINPHHFFSDKSEVTSTDVINSIERVCSRKSQVFEDIKGLDGCVERAQGKNTKLGINKIDKYTIAFSIHCSPTNFLYQLTSPSMVITKITHSGLIGSGSYIVQEKTSEYIKLKNNPYASLYSQVLNPGVVIFHAPWDELTPLLKHKKPDGIIMYRMQDVWDIKDNHYKMLKVNPNITEMLVLNNQRFPFNNITFREAFSSALYNNFNEACIPGAHKAYGLIPYGTGGSIDGNPPKSLPEISTQALFEKIPELAHKKINIILHQLGDSKNDCESRQIIKTANKYNINIKFNYHKNYTSLERLYNNHQLDGFVELYVFKNREAYSILQYFTRTGPNHANISDPTVDTLLQQAISESSSHLRFQAYHRLANYIQEQGIVIPLFYMDHAIIISKCLTGMNEDFLFNPLLHASQLHKIENCSI